MVIAVSTITTIMATTTATTVMATTMPTATITVINTANRLLPHNKPLHVNNLNAATA